VIWGEDYTGGLSLPEIVSEYMKWIGADRFKKPHGRLPLREMGI